MKYPKLRLWARQSRGQTAVIFALMAVPILAVSGFAIDASRQISMKKHAQEAADAAALAGARTFKSAFDTDEAKANATEAFWVNIASSQADAACTIDRLVADDVTLTVSIEVACRVPTMFGTGVSGKTSVAANVTSQAAAIHRIADVVMMYDVSGSMDSTELDHLKVAGTRAAEIVIGVQPGTRGRVGIVPFASGVNAGDFGNKATGRVSGFDGEGDDRTVSGLTIDRVCVTERLGATAFTEDTPSAGQWIGSVITRAEQIASPELDLQSSELCPDSPVHPLDDRLSTVKSAISGIKRSSIHSSGSNTAGHMGVAWTWYMLSPEWASIWTATDFGGHARHKPLPYGDADTVKIAILMTDGIFQWTIGDGFYDPDELVRTANANAATEALCQGMRDAGIIVYGVGYATTAAAEAVLQNCAGDPTRVYTTNNASDLEEIYETIAGEYLGVALIN